MKTLQKTFPVAPSFRARTLSGVIWNKFLDYVQETSWASLFLFFSRFVFALLFALSLVNIAEAYNLFAMALKWNDFTVLKIIGAFLAVFGWKNILGVTKKTISWVREYILDILPEKKDESDIPLFYGIPVVELVEYLFSGDGSFRRDDVEAQFAIPRNRFDEMAKKMDSVKIFVRGENNSRKLNPSFSRGDVSSILFSAVEVGEIRPLFRKISDGVYTRDPSLPSLLSGSSSDVS